MANRDIITRAGKGSDLDATDHDQNHKSFAGTVEEQTASTYEVVYTDQNKTIELNNAAMVCTLDAIVDINSAIDTDNFRVTLINTNSASATVQRSSTDTIGDGSATSISIAQYGAVVLQTDTTSGNWNILAAFNIARQYKKQQYFGESTLSDGANISWDLDNAQSATVTLGGNRTLDNPTNMKAGGTYILRVVQDGTGGRTLSYGTAYKWTSGNAPTVASGASDISLLSFYSDGTSMYGIYALDLS